MTDKPFNLSAVQKDDGEIVISLKPKKEKVVDGFTEEEDGFYRDRFYWGTALNHAKYHWEKFQEFSSQSPETLEKICRDEDGRLKHIINDEHFDLPFLKTICETAHAARRISKYDKIQRKKIQGLEELSQRKPLLNILPEVSVLNFFRQPSSRTFLSFGEAENHLGMRKQSIRDITTSSEAKGEPESDSFRTFSSYGDAIVFRHPSDNADLFALWVTQMAHRENRLFNAGSGKKRHPTQGVLDYYTLDESFRGELDGLSLVFVGDCYRGRTVRSLAKIMALHKNITCYFVAPPALQIDPETEKYLLQRNVKVHKITDRPLNEVIQKIKGRFAVYMTRIQDEHDQEKGRGKYDPNYIFSLKTLDMLPQNNAYLLSHLDHDPHSVLPNHGILMHPMPKREEISPEMDYLKQDPRVLYWREQRNGMWSRTALAAYIFNVDDKIRNFYNKNREKIEDFISSSKTA